MLSLKRHPSFAMLTRLLSRIERAFFSHALIIFLAVYVLCFFFFTPGLRIVDNMFFPSALHRWDIGWGGYMIYVSYLLGFFLSLLTRWIPSIEWYTLYIHICHAVILTCFSFCLIQTREKPRIRNYAGVVFVVIFVLRYMFDIEYTNVSFFTMTSGLLLILKSRENIRRKLLCSLGVMVFLMGCVLRYDSCLGVLPFLLALGFISLCYEPRSLFRIASLVACFTFVLVCHFVQEPLLIVPLKVGGEFNIIRANDVRMRFFDYKDDSGLDKSEMYQRIGCSRNDLRIVSGLIYFPDECRDDRYWKKIASVRDEGTSRFSLKRFSALLREKSAGGSYLRWSLLGCTLLLFVRRQLRPQPADWIALVGILCLVLLGMQGRFNDRAMLAVLIPCYSLWAMLSPSFRVSRVSHAALILLSLFFILRYGCLYANIQQHFSLGGRARWGNPELTAVLVEECNAHPNRLYFAEGHRWRGIILPSSSLRAEDMKKALNFFPLDGWMCLFPSYLSALHSRGITQPSRLLLYDHIRLILHAESEADLVAMRCDSEGLFYYHRLEYFFTFVQERYGIRLRLEVEKKLADGLYVARVVRVEE